MTTSSKILAIGFLAVIAGTLMYGPRRHWFGRGGAGRLEARVADIAWSPPAGASKEELSGPARTLFELINTGGTPVKVTSVDSGCGCAKPQVTPDIVAPGAKAIVDVAAVPPAVGTRSVAIFVNTDSKVTPAVRLSLTLFSVRKPPYVITAAGDLHFSSPIADGSSREIKIVCAENIASKPLPPKIESDLPFLKYELQEHHEKPYPNGVSVERTYVFKVRLDRSATLSPSASGQLRVIDPWSHEMVKTIVVSAPELEKIRLAPRRLIVNVDGAGNISGEKFLVLSNENISDLTVASEDDGAQSFDVIESRSQEDEQELGKTVKSFAVKLKNAKAIQNGMYHISLKSSALSNGAMSLPVMIRKLP